MSIASATARGRSLAESTMLDACLITKPGEGEPVFNEETMQYDPVPPVTVYEGKCSIQIPSDIANSTSAEAGEVDWTLQANVVKLPVVGSEAVRVDHTVTMTASVMDAALVDRKFRVKGLHHKSNATSRRLRCEEIV